jgi:hypothetical protein
MSTMSRPTGGNRRRPIPVHPYRVVRERTSRGPASASHPGEACLALPALHKLLNAQDLLFGLRGVKPQRLKYTLSMTTTAAEE